MSFTNNINIETLRMMFNHPICPLTYKINLRHFWRISNIESLHVILFSNVEPLKCEMSHCCEPPIHSSVKSIFPFISLFNKTWDKAKIKSWNWWIYQATNTILKKYLHMEYDTGKKKTHWIKSVPLFTNFAYSIQLSFIHESRIRTYISYDLHHKRLAIRPFHVIIWPCML